MPPIPASIWSRLSDGAECLPRACARVSEQFYVNQLLLAGNLLIDTINGARENVNAHMVTEIEFALNDVQQLTEELMPREKAHFERCFEALQAAISGLKELAPFPEVEGPLSRLRKKLVGRIDANERSKFAPPGTPKDPLPHPPASMQAEAEQISADLRHAGFETPVLDRLARDPEGFEIRDCDALVKEIDTII